MRKHIVFIRRGIGFPNAMASAERIRQMGGALAEAGAAVTLLTVGTSETPPRVVNTQARGRVDGIDFEYTSGTTVRAESFLVRRLIDIRAHVVAMWRILRLEARHERPAIFLGFDLSGPTLLNYLTTFVARLKGIPVYVEINERPWSMAEKKSWFSRLSPLFGTDGAVVISDFLSKWARETTADRARPYKILQIPILVSDREYADIVLGPPALRVIFSGAIAYASTMDFIIEAMETVWEDFPDCKLAFTGYRGDHPDWKALSDRIVDRGRQDKITLLGYLPRKELLQLYGESWALLIPLFNDVQSTARFPTKLGEYLCSSRPIVITDASETRRYFVDGETAYISQGDTPESFGAAICRALNDEHATDVGSRARAVAEKNFYANLYGRFLYDFF
ncbi:glycosyltransferase [Xanthobacter autotrophicus]|uniref:glycosyltransferase n=1 Tax=Xanthobacter autotrophicus TaxID=280 RepID=UPI001E3FEC5E|nr:glycosyltransferase [Xanthobacter autotrophicus]UDQ88169.1 glycosyltransferase [Xanthobacter autotrophicus]